MIPFLILRLNLFFSNRPDTAKEQRDLFNSHIEDPERPLYYPGKINDSRRIREKIESSRPIKLQAIADGQDFIFNKKIFN